MIQHHAERVDIAARVGVIARLLRGHVLRRAEEHSRVRYLRRVGAVFGNEGFHQTEIEHLDDIVAILGQQHHVGWFEVAVDDADLVGLAQ